MFVVVGRLSVMVMVLIVAVVAGIIVVSGSTMVAETTIALNLHQRMHRLIHSSPSEQERSVKTTIKDRSPQQQHEEETSVHPPRQHTR